MVAFVGWAVFVFFFFFKFLNLKVVNDNSFEGITLVVIDC